MSASGISSRIPTETSIPVTQNPQDKFSVFEKWLKDNGAMFEKLEMRSYDSAGDGVGAHSDEKETKDGGIDESEMGGAHAKEEIPAGEVCVAVPRRCLITVEMGKATPIGVEVIKHNLELDAPKHVFLMLFLLCDRRVVLDDLRNLNVDHFRHHLCSSLTCRKPW